nr:hypothetical protein [Tanacetum cinerariifolium]
MDKSRSCMTRDKHQELYDALLNSIMLDEAIANGNVNPVKVLRKRDRDDDQDHIVGSDQKKKKQRKGKDYEPSKDKIQTGSSKEEPIMDDMVNDSNQPQDDVSLRKDNSPRFKQPPRPETPDPKWNKDKAADDGSEQTWLQDLANAEKRPPTFDDLMSLVYKLLKGTYKSSIELEYNMDQCYNALTFQLDWTNPEGDKPPYDLSKPLSLQGSLGRLTIPVDIFFNNDLEYLKTRNSERKYTMSITKTKAARYELKFIKEMIPKQWSPVKVAYKRNAKLGICHWGPKRQLFYISQINRISKHDIYSSMKISSMVSVKVDKRCGYGYLEEIVVRRADQKLYTFKECDFIILHLNDIKDMLLLYV